MSESKIHHLSNKFVTRLLISEQKEHHIEVCQDLCQYTNDDSSLISRVVVMEKALHPYSARMHGSTAAQSRAYVTVFC